MAVPLDPSVTSIITQALKRAGRTTPSTAQITEATDHALQEVKADIALKAATHPHLLALATTVVTRGQQRYAVPSDFNEPLSISLLTGPSEWVGLAVAGAASAITFPSTLSTLSEADVLGKYILITGGTGQEEYRQIVAYNPSTRVATVDVPWGSAPDGGSTFRIITRVKSLYPTNLKYDFEQADNQFIVGEPELAVWNGQEILLSPIPDQGTYGLQLRYWVDLSKLDETGSLFVQLLREWRSVWIQGVAVKSDQRFDEDRYAQELSVYNVMLDLLASQTCRVSQVQPRDT